MKGVFKVFMDKKNQRPEFHGSDLEKIAAYYHIPASEIPGIIKFGANVNPPTRIGTTLHLRKLSENTVTFPLNILL